MIKPHLPLSIFYLEDFTPLKVSEVRPYWLGGEEMETVEVWESETTNAIHLPNGQVINVCGEITAEYVKSVTRAAGIKKFYVENSDGVPLSERDFPYNGVIHVKEYNEAK